VFTSPPEFSDAFVNNDELKQTTITVVMIAIRRKPGMVRTVGRNSSVSISGIH
jgi:hypothetical protein